MFSAYQLTFTESNFSFTSSFEGFQAADHCTATEFPPYSSFPLDDCSGSLITPDTLGDKEKELLESLRFNVFDAYKLEEETRDQAECDEWMREQKLRFMTSNFGKIVERERNHEKFVKIFWLKHRSQQLQWSMGKSMNQSHCKNMKNTCEKWENLLKC